MIPLVKNVEIAFLEDSQKSLAFPNSQLKHFGGLTAPVMAKELLKQTLRPGNRILNRTMAHRLVK